MWSELDGDVVHEVPAFVFFYDDVFIALVAEKILPWFTTRPRAGGISSRGLEELCEVQRELSRSRRWQ